jgi:hypothetical protein
LAAQSSAEEVAFDQKRVRNRLDVLSRKAEELGQISAAARCEELIGKHRGMFVDCTALLSDLDPDKMTPEILDKISEHFIQKALAGKPTGADGIRSNTRQFLGVWPNIIALSAISEHHTLIGTPECSQDDLSLVLSSLFMRAAGACMVTPRCCGDLRGSGPFASVGANLWGKYGRFS